METLVKNKVFLIETLSADASFILQHAEQEKIITKREYSNLNHPNHTSERVVTNLLDRVINKDAASCERFVMLMKQKEIQETFPNLNQRFSHAAPSHLEDNPVGAACEITEYKMSSKPRGFCLIINNMIFNPPLKDRRGSDVDEESIKEVFHWLGFHLVVYKDLTAVQMKALLKTYSQQQHSGDCFVCCIMSHGSEDGVYGTDGAIISSNDIFDPFSGMSCPGLVNKPKVFFIQACRGEKYQLAVELQADSYEETGAEINDEEMDADEIFTIPSVADFLVVRSTVKGFLSFRNTISGTWFMQSLCTQLKKYCPMGIDVPTILLCVNREVGDKAARLNVRNLVKQMPVHKVTLRKKLVFHVPIQE